MQIYFPGFIKTVLVFSIDLFCPDVTIRQVDGSAQSRESFSVLKCLKQLTRGVNRHDLTKTSTTWHQR